MRVWEKWPTEAGGEVAGGLVVRLKETKIVLGVDHTCLRIDTVSHAALLAGC